MASQIVTVYKNGDKNFAGRKLVVNRRQIRTMDALLDKITRDTKMKQAARAIKTPTGGHTIKQLDKLEAGGCYVAVGTESFKPYQYTEIKGLSRNTPRKQIEITPVKHSRLQMSARAIKVAEAQSHSHKTIHVFRNGDDLYPSMKMLLDKRELASMDTVLKIVTKKVHLQSGAVFWLFTMDGREIKDPSELENGEQYVAVGHGKKFKKVAYSDDSNMLSPRSRVPTKSQIKVSNQKTNKPVKVKHHNYAVSGQSASKGYKRKSSSTSNSQASSHEDYTARKPSDEIQDIIKEEIQEEFISQPPAQRSPTPTRNPSPTRSPSPKETHHGVYEASGENQENAKEVQDDREVKEDKPIDQLPAEEIDEEEVEDDTRNDNDKENEDKNKENKQDEERSNSGFGGFIGDLIDDVREKFDSDDDEEAKKDQEPDKNNTGAKDDT